MEGSKKNENLNKAKRNRKDEFYTQIADIERELENYTKHLKDKIVYCNCDDPYESNFFKFFANKFNKLELKELVATSYYPSPIVGKELPVREIAGLKPEGKEPFVVRIREVKDFNKDGAIDFLDIKYLLESKKNVSASLKDNGDFRSNECIELLKQADVVITNPPFSLFREYVEQLVEYKKKFLIIGNFHAITYIEVFKLIKKNKIWLGCNSVKEFVRPDKTTQTFGNIMWYTNLSHKKRNEEFPLFKTYKESKKEYPKYDNYDAIEVSSVNNIPKDYKGVMGVPVSFMSKFNPNQFEIVGSNRGVKQDPQGIYGRSSYIDGKERFKRLFIKHKK